jgi:hypothetical protein
MSWASNPAFNRSVMAMADSSDAHVWIRSIGTWISAACGPVAKV